VFRIVPGDLGTKGGMVTDARARVLRADDTVIPGLYAVGKRERRGHGSAATPGEPGHDVRLHRRNDIANLASP
jgi:3-oxosteroid 1-dehydrogenase